MCNITIVIIVNGADQFTTTSTTTTTINIMLIMSEAEWIERLGNIRRGDRVLQADERLC